MNIEIIELKPFVDPRGSLLKVLRREAVSGDQIFGEIYLVTAHPGETRAGHYHQQITEWFCLIEGEADLTLHDKGDDTRQTLQLSSKLPRTIKVSPNIVHTFINTGQSNFTLLAYADRPYDPANTDTYIPESTGS